MNIMPFYDNPYESVKVLDDKRVGPLLKEAVQILSADGNGPYKPAWLHHPVVMWANDCRPHRDWTIHWCIALYNEWKYRFNSTHKSGELFCDWYEKDYLILTLRKPPIVRAFCNAARRKDKNIDFTTEPNTHLAYRLYIQERWRTDVKPCVWTKREHWGGLQP